MTARHQLGMHAGEDLRHPPAGGVAPDRDVAQPELTDQALDVADVVFDEIAAFRVPAGIAVAAHVHGDDVESRREMRGEMIERARHTIETVNAGQRAARAPQVCPSPHSGCEGR